MLFHALYIRLVILHSLLIAMTRMVFQRVFLLRIGCLEIECLLQATALIALLAPDQTRFSVWEYLLIPLLDDVNNALLLLSQTSLQDCKVLLVVVEITNAGA